MKPQTEEFLYFLLWSCDRFCRPTWRNLTDSFEAWAYRNDLHRQLAALEKQNLLQRQGSATDERIFRLTEHGRLRALGGRDPEAQWSRPWDGQWRLVLFDVPSGQDRVRKRLRRFLHHRGFGYLQKSVWISPDPFSDERSLLGGSQIDVESLILLEARPSAGESDQEIVAGAWDFNRINNAYTKYLKTLRARPTGALKTPAMVKRFHSWARDEKLAWTETVSQDPLLPERLLAPDYLGRKAWEARREILAEAAVQLDSFAL